MQIQSELALKPDSLLLMDTLEKKISHHGCSKQDHNRTLDTALYLRERMHIIGKDSHLII